MNDELAIEIRQGTERDEPFVFDTWLNGGKRGTYEAKRIRDCVYFPRRRKLIEAILNRGAKTLIAHPPGDPDTIYGCLVYEEHPVQPVLHWIFVKLAWRRLHVATRLLESAVSDPNLCAFTCWTSWRLSVPAAKSIKRSDEQAVRSSKREAQQRMEQSGEGGGDTEDLLRRYPRMLFDPDRRWEPA